jgi:pentose-5-phosphate-3-epimerase
MASLQFHDANWHGDLHTPIVDGKYVDPKTANYILSRTMSKNMANQSLIEVHLLLISLSRAYTLNICY